MGHGALHQVGTSCMAYLPAGRGTSTIPVLSQLKVGLVYDRMCSHMAGDAPRQFPRTLDYTGAAAQDPAQAVSSVSCTRLAYPVITDLFDLFGF